MFSSRDRPTRLCATRLHLLLVVALLHEDMAQIRDMHDSGKTCAGGAGGEVYNSEGPVKDRRGSLLQVKRTKPPEPSTVSEELHAMETYGGAKEAHVSQLGAALESHISRLGEAAVAKIEHWTGRRVPKLFILTLVFLTVVVTLLFLFSSRVEQTESRGIGQEGRIEKVRGNEFNNASLMPPTNTVRSAPPSLQNLRRQGIPMAISRHLCAGLVVPQGNECVLAVPFLPETISPGRNTIPLIVQDFEGAPVIQADVVMPRSASTSDPHHPFIVLRAGPQSRSHLLAYCKCGHDFATRKVAYLHDGQDQLFAQISKDYSSCYILSANRAGLQYYLEGNVKHQAVRVTNEDQRIMAETSSEAVPFDASSRSFYKLRVAGNVDVGLILCALFSMDFLERS